MKYLLPGLVLTLFGCATTSQPEVEKSKVISITNDVCFIDDQKVDLAELSEHLDSNDHIQIKPTPTTLHKRIISVMDECAEAMVKNISFVTSDYKDVLTL